MTKIFSPLKKSPVRNEQAFLKELEAILPSDSFQARIFPSDDGNVAKAKVNTKESLDMEVLKQLISLAGKYKLPIDVSRSGAGLRILFGTE